MTDPSTARAISIWLDAYADDNEIVVEVIEPRSSFDRHLLAVVGNTPVYNEAGVLAQLQADHPAWSRLDVIEWFSFNMDCGGKWLFGDVPS